jgi:hypothetical protein
LRLGAYSRTTYSRSAPHHLDVPADAVLLVDDVVARLERQWIDAVAASSGEGAAGGAGAGASAGELALGEERQLRLGVDESLREEPSDDREAAGRGGLLEPRGELGAESGVGELLGDALGGAVPRYTEDSGVPVALPVGELLHGGCEVAPVGRCR